MNGKESANRDEAINAVQGRGAPFVLSLGGDMHLVVEGLVFCHLEAGGITDAILHLMAAYYVFNLKYSSAVEPSLLFIQSNCLMLTVDKKFQSISLFFTLIEKEKKTSADINNDVNVGAGCSCDD